jgi:hypothetical protein
MEDNEPIRKRKKLIGVEDNDEVQALPNVPPLMIIDGNEDYLPPVRKPNLWMLFSVLAFLSILLFGVFGSPPYKYYEFVRFSITVGFGVLSYLIIARKRDYGVLIFTLPFVILYNPLFRFRFSKFTWGIFDGGIAIGLLSLSGDLIYPWMQDERRVWIYKNKMSRWIGNMEKKIKAGKGSYHDAVSILSVDRDLCHEQKVRICRYLHKEYDKLTPQQQREDYIYGHYNG